MMTTTRKSCLSGILFLACAMPAQAQEVPVDVATLRAAVLSETNAYRASKNLPQLQENAALEAAATAYATYLAKHGAMGHTADGGNPGKRVSAQGYKWCFISENVWNSFPKPQATLSEELARKAMDGWKRSPGHNANLLEKRSHEVGIGAAGWKQDGGREILRVVQVFATACPGKKPPAPTLRHLIDSAADALR